MHGVRALAALSGDAEARPELVAAGAVGFLITARRHAATETLTTMYAGTALSNLREDAAALHLQVRPPQSLCVWEALRVLVPPCPFASDHSHRPCPPFVQVCVSRPPSARRNAQTGAAVQGTDRSRGSHQGREFGQIATAP